MIADVRYKMQSKATASDRPVQHWQLLRSTRNWSHVFESFVLALTANDLNAYEGRSINTVSYYKTA